MHWFPTSVTRRFRVLSMCTATWLSVAVMLAGPTPAAAHGAATVRRDAFGVPHVYADSVFGLYYGFGYALAEDHLFQMDVMRRIATGRVAEVFGDKYVEVDRGVRTSVDAAAVAAQYRRLAGADRAIFDGYAAGYNARVREVLAARQTLLPAEFATYGFDPKEWTPVDVLLAFIHPIAIRFCDLNLELENLALLFELRKTHGAADAWAIFEQLRWEADPHAVTTIAADEQTRAPPPTFAAVPPGGGFPRYLVPPSDALVATVAAAALGPDSFPHASNIWVLGPRRMAGGEALLINGPQMGNFSPGYIWAAGLHGAGYDVVGNGPLGSPMLLFARNASIGWGSTAAFGDTVDTYQERLDPADPHRYWFRGRYLRMSRRDETIRVKDGAPIHLEVYRSVHGPVLQFDVGNHVAYARKRSWEGHEAESLVAWVHSMRARTYGEWRRALASMSLTINNYFVDHEGNIAYAYLGRYPKRPATQDFRLPASGTGEMEWSGTRPFASNPHLRNPARGYIANWNNKPQPNYHSSDSWYWGAIDQAQVLFDRIAPDRRFTVDEAWSVIRQTSYRDANARYFLPLVAAAAPGWRADGSARQAASLLAQWDGDTVSSAPGGGTAPAELLMMRFLAVLIDDVLRADVPAHVYRKDMFAPPQPLAAVTPFYPTMGTKIVYNALLGPASGVPQRFDFLHGRKPADVIESALGAAFDALKAERGPDPRAWMVAAAPHVFSTMTYAGVPAADPARVVELPEFMNRGTENDRIVFGPAGASSCDVTPPGESGFTDPRGVLAPHYLDQVEVYRTFGCKPEPLHPADGELGEARVLRY